MDTAITAKNPNDKSRGIIAPALFVLFRVCRRTSPPTPFTHFCFCHCRTPLPPAPTVLLTPHTPPTAFYHSSTKSKNGITVRTRNDGSQGIIAPAPLVLFRLCRRTSSHGALYPFLFLLLPRLSYPLSFFRKLKNFFAEQSRPRVPSVRLGPVTLPMPRQTFRYAVNTASILPRLGYHAHSPKGTYPFPIRSILSPSADLPPPQRPPSPPLTALAGRSPPCFLPPVLNASSSVPHSLWLNFPQPFWGIITLLPPTPAAHAEQPNNLAPLQGHFSASRSPLAAPPVPAPNASSFVPRGLHPARTWIPSSFATGDIPVPSPLHTCTIRAPAVPQRPPSPPLTALAGRSPPCFLPPAPNTSSSVPHSLRLNFPLPSWRHHFAPLAVP